MDRADLVNKRFGQLSVTEWVKRDRYGNQWWGCLCDCGEVVTVVGCNLKNGKVDCCPKCRKARGYSPVGERLGKITVLEVLGIAKDFGLSGRGLMVQGKCECGNLWRGPLTSLRRGNTKSCGCIPTGVVPDPNRERSAINSVLSGYKRHALRRNLSWELSDQEFEDLIKGVCYYCGSSPSSVSCHNRNRDGGKRRRTISEVTRNGIDRKDNLIGYTSDNSVSCCSTCNYSKRGLSSGAFLEHIQRIYLVHFGGL